MPTSTGNRRDFDGMRRRRAKAWKLYAEGESQSDVARELGVSRQSALRWYLAWRSGDRIALRGAGRAGRRPRLDDAQRDAVAKQILQGPTANGFRTQLWTLPRIAAVVEKVTGVHYHPGHVWKILRQMGWSLQRPTTRARERDEAGIRRWVRETWPAVKKTPHALAR